MTVSVNESDVIVLHGDCPSEDAETLLACLIDAPGAMVDWRECENAHTAVVQVLMAAGVTPQGSPRSAFLRQMVEPGMKSR